MMATMRAMGDVFRLETDAGVVVAGHVEVAGSVLSRFRGLMFRDQLQEGHGLALRPCSSIHMFFMRFPLDVVFVDGDGAVVHVYHGLRPWRMSRIVRRAKAAIELPDGTLERAGVRVGDVVRLVSAER
jgi:uncharacterized membrane protein (UPF0127 family)